MLPGVLGVLLCIVGLDCGCLLLVGYGLICCCFVGGVAGLFDFVAFTLVVGCLVVVSLLA